MIGEWIVVAATVVIALAAIVQAYWARVASQMTLANTVMRLTDVLSSQAMQYKEAAEKIRAEDIDGIRHDEAKFLEWLAGRFAAPAYQMIKGNSHVLQKHFGSQMPEDVRQAFDRLMRKTPAEVSPEIEGFLSIFRK